MIGSGSGTGNATLQVTLFNSNNSYAGWNVAFSNSMTMSTSAFTFTGKFDPQASAFNLSQVTGIQVMTAGSGSSTVNYTMTNFSYGAVPAPGAVALIGVAGLVGSRRRRA
jgi:MYXO-CTERM domain-containing protein